MTELSNGRLTGKLCKYLWLVLLTYLVLTPIWLVFAPYYSRFQAGIANAVIGHDRLSGDVRTFSYENGQLKGEIAFTVATRSKPNGQTLKVGMVWDHRLFQFGLVIWVALILPTPFRDWKSRISACLVGALIVLFGQIVDMYLQPSFGKLEGLRKLAGEGEYKLSSLQEYVLTWSYVSSLRIWSVLVPILLWLIMGARQLRTLAEPRKQPVGKHMRV